MLTFTKNILIHTGFWLLLPISAIQGLRLRTRAVRLPEATDRGLHGASRSAKHPPMVGIGAEWPASGAFLSATIW